MADPVPQAASEAIVEPTTVIGLDDVSVTFEIYGSGSRSIKRRFLRSVLGRSSAGDDADAKTVAALRNITVDIKHGDRIALIGKNGSGKTTLLRVLAGVYEPVSGTVTRNGEVSALFDLTLGMNPEATGYENIHTRALYLGLSPQKIEEREADIVAFSELGESLARPIRTYSTGMLLRLAFAISTCVQPEVLLLDEWIGVGDALFLAKAEERLNQLVDRSSVLVLASHSPDLLRRFCTKGILLNEGRLMHFGPIDDVLADYTGWILI